MKTVTPGIDHQKFRDELLALLNKYTGELDSVEMLAVCAITTGQIIAMQDSRIWTSDALMDLVAKNIEMGNAQAVAEASKWMGNA